MSFDFWTGVVVALVVSVIANLVTPITRAALFALLAKSAHVVRAFGSWGRRKAYEAAANELALLTEYHASPLKLTLTLGWHFAINLFLLWLLVFAFGFVYMIGELGHPKVAMTFFGFLGATTSTFFIIIVVMGTIEKLRDFDAYSLRAEARLASLRPSAESGAKGG